MRKQNGSRAWGRELGYKLLIFEWTSWTGIEKLTRVVPFFWCICWSPGSILERKEAHAWRKVRKLVLRMCNKTYRTYIPVNDCYTPWSGPISPNNVYRSQMSKLWHKNAKGTNWEVGCTTYIPDVYRKHQKSDKLCGRRLEVNLYKKSTHSTPSCQL